MRIVQACHVDVTSGHLGVRKTYHRITERFMWIGVLKDVKKVVCSMNDQKLVSSLIACVLLY